ncbi:MAG: glycoside hydrolase family 28 protein [Bacteroidota bacterium]
MRPLAPLALAVLFAAAAGAQPEAPQTTDPPYVTSPPTPTGFSASADFAPVPTPAFVAEAWTPEAAAAQEAAAWAMVPAIVSRIEAPRIPDRECVVTDYGATADSTGADDRPGILAALADCAEQGGGRVVLPPGDYLSNGPIHFRDRIALHLEAGALLHFGYDPEMYEPLVRGFFEGVELYNYSPLLYADGLQDIAITGAGTIDGQADQFWWQWKDLDRPRRERLQETPGNKPLIRQMGNDQVPVAERIFGGGTFDLDGDGANDGDGQQRYLRPSLVQFIESERILIEGVTLRNSPFWTVHPVLCEHVTVRGTTIQHGTTNDDGIDPENSRYVLIEGNDIATDDDPIALKAGRDADGRRRPSTAFVVIRDNRLQSRLGGAMSIGSEMSGGVEWVFIEGNVGTNERGRGLYLKSNLDRGGFMRHVYVRDLDLTDSVIGFGITNDYHSWRGTVFPTDVHDIFVSDVRIWNADEASMQLVGHPDAHVRRVWMRDLTIRGPEALASPVLDNTDAVLADGVTINGAPFRPAGDTGGEAFDADAAFGVEPTDGGR